MCRQFRLSAFDSHVTQLCAWVHAKKTGAVPRRGASSTPPQIRVYVDVWFVECLGGRTCTQVSMMDVDIFRAIMDVMSIAEHARCIGEGGGRERGDTFGDVHVVLFGDFKSAS